MLNRNITFITGLAISISMVIGSGLFALPGLAIETTDPITAMISWIVVIIIMPPMISIFVYMGSNYSSTEGISLYASMAFGEWSRLGISLVVCGTLAIGMPAFFMVGGSYISELLEIDKSIWTIPIGIILALLTTIINIFGVDKLGLINKVVVICILFLVIYIVYITLSNFSIENNTIGMHIDEANIELSSIWLSSSIIFWAFQGWENMTFSLGEINNPKIIIPRIYWASFGIVSIIYILFAASATIAHISGHDISGISGISSIIGEGVSSKILIMFIIVTLIANASSWTYGASRAFYSSALRGALPSSIGKVSSNNIPVISLISAFILYIFIMSVMWIFDIHPKYAFLLTTQGFILLYGGTIIAYLRLVSGIKRYSIGMLAFISWIFLMHGFGIMIIYPLILFSIGIVIYIRNDKYPIINYIDK